MPTERSQFQLGRRLNGFDSGFKAVHDGREALPLAGLIIFGDATGHQRARSNSRCSWMQAHSHPALEH